MSECYKRKTIRRSLAMLVALAMLFAMFPLVMVEAGAVNGAASTLYYVDSIGGNDANTGTSEASPWQTLVKVNSTTFAPGDRILLKAGSSWNGQLWPKGSGTEGSVIAIDMYGSGAKPIINGGGVNDTVYLYNQEYWEIQNLEITNIASSEAVREGIRVNADISDRFLSHIVIKNCYIHDVTGIMSRKDTGGLIVSGNYNDILIEGNTVRNVYRTGILVAAKHNAIVRNNMVDSIGGDGIQVGGGATSPLIEYNVAKDCYNRYTSGAYNVAIWPFDTNDALLQYNEAYLTHTTLDGQGFDCDYLCNGTTFQYNYSHDNEGGFMLICSIAGSPDYQRYNRNSVIRYNISQNDKNRIFQIHSPGTQGTQIYNNTIYIGAGLSPKIYDFDMWRKPGTVYSYNNIFYNAGKGTYFYGAQNYHVFEHNLFYGYHPSSEPGDPYKITADPMLVAPGTGGVGINTVGGYMLQAGSPAINAGKYISNNGGKDYWGNTLYNGAPDIGANEYSGQIYEPLQIPYDSLAVSHNASGSGENQIAYAGSWQWSNDDHWSNSANASYSVGFTGRQIKVCGPKDYSHGIMAVSIDGGTEILVDTYASSRSNEILFDSGLLPMGSHTLSVRVTGDKNPSSSNSYVDIQQVEISPTYKTVRSYDTGVGSGKIDYYGSWSFGDNDSWSTTPNSYYQMTFTGSAVKVVGAKDPSFSTIGISIDGGAETVISVASSGRQENCTLFEMKNLADSTHTVKVRLLANGGCAVSRIEYLPTQNGIYQ